MSAWVLALCCLLSTDLSTVRITPPKAELAVYLTVGLSQPSAPLELMKREVSSLMDAAGYRVAWQDSRHPNPIGETSPLVVLELRGSCGMPGGSFRPERAVASGASLAETYVDGEGVHPFSWVNCDNLTRMIGPALASEAPAVRDSLYGRAIARVVAHEFYHVMMGSRDHGHDGIARPRFTVADLLNEHFDFDTASLSKLRRRAVDGDGESDTSIGR